MRLRFLKIEAREYCCGLTLKGNSTIRTDKYASGRSLTSGAQNACTAGSLLDEASLRSKLSERTSAAQRRSSVQDPEASTSSRPHSVADSENSSVSETNTLPSSQHSVAGSSFEGRLKARQHDLPDS